MYAEVNSATAYAMWVIIREPYSNIAYGSHFLDVRMYKQFKLKILDLKTGADRKMQDHFTGGPSLG